MGNVLLTADSPCDLGEDLKECYQLHYYPYHIILEDREYTDGVDVTPDDLFRAYRERKVLPKTAAIGIGEYMEFFRPLVEQGFEIVHFCLGSALSAAYQNCCATAEELGHVYPIDARSLSTGIGLQVLEAAEMARTGMPAAEIQKEARKLADRSHASFILDTLEFMHAGGRCSTVAALGANLLKLKPCIEVHPEKNGAMEVGKKYRGDLHKVLVQYTKDVLNRDDLQLDRVFITHSGIPQEYVDLVRDTIIQCADFREIYATRASCTISCHCGPNTLGVLFLTKE